MRRLTRSSVLVLGALLLPGVAAETRGRGLVEWEEQIDRIDRQLKQGDWEPARQAAERLATTLAEHCGGTRGDKRIHADELGGAMAGHEPVAAGIALGRASALLAIAEAGVGSEDAARWHWYAAQNLDRTLRHLDLTAYGEAGAFLGRHVLAAAEVQHANLVDVLDPVRPEGDMLTRFREPERIAVVYPERPEDLRNRDRFSHAVFVQVTVDTSGRMTQPLVVDAAFYPGLVYKAFEALRHWRYRPATLNGEPVPFRYVIPVVFADDRPEQSAVFF